MNRQSMHDTFSESNRQVRRRRQTVYRLFLVWIRISLFAVLKIRAIANALESFISLQGTKDTIQ
jgi:hypothetical protein